MLINARKNIKVNIMIFNSDDNVDSIVCRAMVNLDAINNIKRLMNRYKIV